MADSNLTTTVNSVTIGGGGVYGLMNYIGAFHIGGGIKRYTLNRGYFANNVLNNRSHGEYGRYGYGINNHTDDADKGYIDETTGKIYVDGAEEDYTKLQKEQRTGDRVGDYYTTKGLPRVSEKEFMDTKTFSLLGEALRNEQTNRIEKEYLHSKYGYKEHVKNFTNKDYTSTGDNDFGDLIELDDAKQVINKEIKKNDKTKKGQEFIFGEKGNKYTPYVGEEYYHLDSKPTKERSEGLDFIGFEEEIIKKDENMATPEGFKTADKGELKFPEKDWTISGVSEAVRNFYIKYTRKSPDPKDEKRKNLKSVIELANAKFNTSFGEAIAINDNIDSLFKDDYWRAVSGVNVNGIVTPYENNAISALTINKIYELNKDYGSGIKTATNVNRYGATVISEHVTGHYEFKGINQYRAEGFKTPDFKTALISFSYIPDKENSITYSYYREAEKGEVPTLDGMPRQSVSFNGSVINIKNKGTKSPIVRRVNEYFSAGQINSLINRFHTEAKGEAVDGEFVTAKTEYGLSRGRNLLKAKENRVKNENGYENPYCRVWTAHKQYSTMKDRIRPFMEGEDFMKLTDLQKKLYGTNWTRPNPQNFEYSVLQDSGFVRIAPHRDSNAKLIENKDNLKNYMFSIENLAWKDYADTRFLSDEQIGPNGGRIMWFPPYNLKFNENVNTTWRDNDFIGRGEKIYTYVNTERAGTLNFTLLIDHPSVINKWEKDPKDKERDEQKLLRFFAGCGPDVLSPKKDNDPTARNEEDKPSVEPKEQDPKPIPFSFIIFFPNNFSGVDYEDNLSGLIQELDKYETTQGGTTEIVDDSFKNEKYNDKVNYVNKNMYGLNTTEGLKSYLSHVKQIIPEAQVAEHLYSYQEFKDFMKKMFPETEESPMGPYLTMFGEYNLRDYEIKSMVPRGYASSDGVVSRNDKLFRNRSNTTRDLTKYFLNGMVDESLFEEDNREYGAGIVKLQEGDNATIRKRLKLKDSEKIPENSTPKINRLAAKIARCGIITVNIALRENLKLNPTGEVLASGTTGTTENEEQTQAVSATNSLWKTREYTEYSAQGDYTYQNEYLYFEQITKDNNIVYKNIMDKIKFFDPAFHSLTPEGFNARLSFLHQCTRQGPTIGSHSGGDLSNDKKEDAIFKMAGNLAFGKAPYCILRIGDFFNSKIVITSVQIDYDTGSGIQWDLNPEGIGVQPMMANISISFNFIGGQDMTGPVAELQNALSFNYYANSSLYESRKRITE